MGIILYNQTGEVIIIIGRLSILLDHLLVIKICIYLIVINIGLKLSLQVSATEKKLMTNKKIHRSVKN